MYIIRVLVKTHKALVCEN